MNEEISRRPAYFGIKPVSGLGPKVFPNPTAEKSNNIKSIDEVVGENVNVESLEKTNDIEIASPQMGEDITISKEMGDITMDEKFQCGVCGKEFNKHIALLGHKRGPCGKKPETQTQPVENNNQPNEVEGK